MYELKQGDVWLDKDRNRWYLVVTNNQSPFEMRVVILTRDDAFIFGEHNKPSEGTDEVAYLQSIERGGLQYVCNLLEIKNKLSEKFKEK